MQDDLLRITAEQVSLEVYGYLFGDLPRGFFLVFSGVLRNLRDFVELRLDVTDDDVFFDLPLDHPAEGRFSLGNVSS